MCLGDLHVDCQILKVWSRGSRSASGRFLVALSNGQDLRRSKERKNARRHFLDRPVWGRRDSYGKSTISLECCRSNCGRMRSHAAGPVNGLAGS